MRPKADSVPTTSPARRIVLVVLALVFFSGAAFSSWKVITHTTASTNSIQAILKLYSMKNEGAVTLDKFKKEHPILGFFAGSTAEKQLKLPSTAAAEDALHSEVPRHLKEVRKESNIAAWWSWFLLCLSGLYVVTVIALERRHDTRPVLFALTSISLFFFIIGIIAPAMVIWTAPHIPMATGDFDFVVQYQVRGIWAIIWELLTANHFMIGGFLLLFSIVTPMTKASLTYVTTFSQSKKLNTTIGNILHTIGKWSMADVFVAAILLALYALKFQQATQSVPCLGLYYFIGYCLLSLTTTQILVGSGVVEGNEGKSNAALGLNVIGGLVVALFCFVGASSLYTYQQYTENTKEKIKAPSGPKKLDNSLLVLPGHK